MRNTTTLSYDFDEMIRQARLQRTAAIAHGLVDAAIAIGKAFKSAFGSATPKTTLVKQGT